MDQTALGRRGAATRWELDEFMQHRGVQFSVREALPGEWRYSFKIDGKTISGKTQTRLQLLAVRRAKDRINRALNRSAAIQS
ncbi:hypothetical protein [Bradyrhizobium elkanii]|uniref:hypothetical protein n=1 Tax=Bradyrhizobium elkanii TaxID=29448 RepID=UPI002167C48E|nr:hypothetical protein [Bradyrhizobium elkanii]MCS3519295.1 hypothetical protein [Bradyrhizobium elkanii]MCS4066952.1 hypothetical protein [Bradyrhizobium elkanii]MCS4082487.1 hypothetical protein [Bradyrhizobium elkanii]MCW2127894.1 hypothetical protein [Bradyrhizobium elkanii]MCW2174637.1 hypothetical protein [Bradyrhizobium elkanii]